MRQCVVDQLELAGSLDARYPALTAANQTSRVVGPGYNHAIAKHTWYLQWGANVTQGEAIIETAPDPSYTGSWAALHNIPFSAAGSVDMKAHDGTLGASRVRMLQAADGVGVTVKFSGHRG